MRASRHRKITVKMEPALIFNRVFGIRKSTRIEQKSTKNRAIQTQGPGVYLIRIYHKWRLRKSNSSLIPRMWRRNVNAIAVWRSLRPASQRFSDAALSAEGRPGTSASTLTSSSRSGQRKPSPQPMRARATALPRCHAQASGTMPTARPWSARHRERPPACPPSPRKRWRGGCGTQLPNAHAKPLTAHLLLLARGDIRDFIGPETAAACEPDGPGQNFAILPPPSI
jgi:hypothetical protein